MKVKVVYRLYYKNRSIDKSVNIRKCRDKLHARSEFNTWAKKRYKNAIDMKILSLESMHESIGGDSAVEQLKRMFGMN